MMTNSPGASGASVPSRAVVPASAGTHSAARTSAKSAVSACLCAVRARARELRARAVLEASCSGDQLALLADVPFGTADLSPSTVDRALAAAIAGPAMHDVTTVAGFADAAARLIASARAESVITRTTASTLARGCVTWPDGPSSPARPHATTWRTSLRPG